MNHEITWYMVSYLSWDKVAVSDFLQILISECKIREGCIIAAAINVLQVRFYIAYISLQVEEKSHSSYKPIESNLECEMDCGVCFTSLGDSGKDSTEGMIILPCQHSFCQMCMLHYAVEKIKTGSLSITCMVRHCRTYHVLKFHTIKKLWLRLSIFKKKNHCLVIFSCNLKFQSWKQ